MGIPVNTIFDDRPTAEVDDIEVEAYIVRLCRAAPVGMRAAKILGEARDAYPGIDEERLKRCAASAAERLKAQGGY